MSGFLKEMARSSLERLRNARAVETEKGLWQRASDAPAAPPLKLGTAGFDVIAELKLRSPAKGVLRASTEDLAARVRAYAQGGAAAVSVLTEPYHFDGSMAHLARASETLAPLGVPTMRKDFIIEPYQVMEARAVGAGGVLVILRMLDHGRITELLDCAAMLKMFVLLEGFDEELAPKLPTEVPRVAESGVATPGDAARLARVGYQLVLVGAALMTDDHPETLVSRMVSAGRAARVPAA
jgi:indole-3-glycerol phosphate synthase